MNVERLHKENIPIHAILVKEREDILLEEYYLPYQRGILHRCFSITKSFVSLGIGALYAENKLSLDDPVLKFFSLLFHGEQLENPALMLKDVTIRSMLCMQTCHSKTSYKENLSYDWVRSFFTVPPDHPAGRIFCYDSAGIHVLTAIVSALSGKGVLEYLREIYLQKIGFSEKAYILKNTFGQEIGASGLMASAEDLMCVLDFILEICTEEKIYLKKNLVTERWTEEFWEKYVKFLRKAMCCQAFTNGVLYEERLRYGYGYGFWLLPGGATMYGMGGQFAAVFPQSGRKVVILADTQGMSSGEGRILEEVCSASLISEDTSPGIRGMCEKENLNFGMEKGHVGKVWEGDYCFFPNIGGFQRLSLKKGEVLIEQVLENREVCYHFSFPSQGGATVPTENIRYGDYFFTEGRWISEKELTLSVQVLWENMGKLFLELCFEDGSVVVQLKKEIEFIYPEFSGFLRGNRVNV